MAASANGRLKHMKRTGWVIRNIPELETNSENNGGDNSGEYQWKGGDDGATRTVSFANTLRETDAIITKQAFSGKG